MSQDMNRFVAEVLSYVSPQKCEASSAVRVKIFGVLRDHSTVRHWADSMAADMLAEMEEGRARIQELLGIIDRVQKLASQHRKVVAEHYTEKYWWCRPLTTYGEEPGASSMAMSRVAIVPRRNHWEMDYEEAVDMLERRTAHSLKVRGDSDSDEFIIVSSS
ncbi:hypothetical protein COOONC_15464 [Cooperia oncophora]